MRRRRDEHLDFRHFAACAQNLVRYYNVPAGFTVPDGQHASPSAIAITWWGIYNEPNFNNLDSTEYTRLYNTVGEPRMQAVDPSLKCAAVELGDYSGLASQFRPAFVAQATAPVDVLATHSYSTCHQHDTDAGWFATAPGFVSEVSDTDTHLHTNPILVNVPVWVTENHVDADFDKGGGISACNGATLVTDLRGNGDGSVVVMVANHAVNSPATDNNGPGVPFKVTADVSALGAFTSASLLLIDKDTSLANGLVATPMTPAAEIALDWNGYSVGILTLEPRTSESATGDQGN